MKERSTRSFPRLIEGVPSRSAGCWDADIWALRLGVAEAFRGGAEPRDICKAAERWARPKVGGAQRSALNATPGGDCDERTAEGRKPLTAPEGRQSSQDRRRRRTVDWR